MTPKANLWRTMAEWSWFDRQLIYEWLGLETCVLPAQRTLDPRLVDLLYRDHRPTTIQGVVKLWMDLDFIQSHFTSDEQNELISALTAVHAA